MKRCRYVALTTVTIADNSVKAIMMHTPNLVENLIWSFQNTMTGTIARTMSVIVVHALKKYEKLFRTSGLQHEPPTTDESQSRRVGLHWRNTIRTETKASMTCRVTMP